jgi:hypothetical protein
MLSPTVLVLIMTMPGTMLFYGGLLRTKSALSIVAHTIAAAAVVTLVARISRRQRFPSPCSSWSSSPLPSSPSR